MILIDKIKDIRELIKEALQQFGIHYEEITANSTNGGKTIVLAKKNCPLRFGNFIRFIKKQGYQYNSYFCPTRERIKVDVSI